VKINISAAFRPNMDDDDDESSWDEQLEQINQEPQYDRYVLKGRNYLDDKSMDALLNFLGEKAGPLYREMVAERKSR